MRDNRGVRMALISMVHGPGGPALPFFAGKSVAERQLEFALALGCNIVICLSHTLKAGEIALQHAAERAGARFHCTGDPHALPRLAGTAEQFIVMDPGLLPLALEAYDALDKGNGILVLPSETGIAAGFERIDLNHAWGGALSMPGRLVGEITALPQDCDAVSALLRIAVQARLPERAIPEKLLVSGQWMLLRPGAELAEQEAAWLDSRIERHGDGSATGGLAAMAVRTIPREKIGGRRLVSGLMLAAVVLAAGGAAIASQFGMAGTGILLLAPAALSLGLAGLLKGLQGDTWAPRKSAGRGKQVILAILDITLIFMVYHAISGTWNERIFPPLMLVGLIRLGAHVLPPRIASFAADRALIALIAGTAALLDRAGVAIMALAALLLAALIVSVMQGKAANAELTNKA